MTILKAENVSHSYSGSILALEQASIDVEEGDFWVILGPNGSGKSTFVRAISGAIRPSSGRVSLEGRDIFTLSHKEIARSIAFVPQSVQVDFPFTCRQVVLMGRFSHLGGLGIEKDEDYQIADEAMRLTGVHHLAGRMINQLSGGERQRVIIAQAVAASPRLLILDEPLSSLDIKYQLTVLELVKDLCQNRGITVIAVLHDLNFASQYGRKAMLLKGGRGRLITPLTPKKGGNPE
jgi:iron complex transport system ATP-binding protein